MKNIRTDLALEAQEIWQESASEESALPGVVANEEEISGMTVTRVEVLDERGSEYLGKPIGNYTTVEISGITRRDAEVFPRAIETVASELSKMLPQGDGCVLIAGLGNKNITPDAVGALATDNIMVTRHLISSLPDMFGSLKPVAAIVPGVLGTTGIESRELIRGAIAHTEPKCVIVIDALASRRLSRLCRTVQITDTGITPGSGVGNSRAAINKETVGVPVIALGVPTVVDIRTLIYDTAEQAGTPLPDSALDSIDTTLMVTPKEIDVRVSDIGKIIGYAINSALQPGVTPEDMDVFLS